jgi:hypothetical protein
MSTFTFTTEDPDLAMRICALLLPQHVRSDSLDDANDPKIVQIQNALAYRPLSPIELSILRVWFESEDWTPVGAIHQRVTEEKLAQNMEQAVRLVRAALSGLAKRMKRKVGASTKLEGLVEVRREAGSAAYRLHRDGRRALQKLL